MGLPRRGCWLRDLWHLYIQTTTKKRSTLMSVILKDVGKQYKNNDRFVFQGLTLTIEAGSVYCLLGKNGAGKSTLLNILTDTLQATTGEVSIDGLSYSQHPIRIKRQTGVLSQF